MKTAEEYLTNSGQACEYSHDLEVVPKADVLIFMKEYASQVAEQALKDASLRVKSNSALGDMITTGILETPIKTP